MSGREEDIIQEGEAIVGDNHQANEPFYSSDNETNKKNKKIEEGVEPFEQDDDSSDDSEQKKKKDKKKEKNEIVGVFEIFRYADKYDIVFMIVGGICAAAAGGGTPAFSFALGRLMDDLLTADPESSAAESALIMTYIGIAVSVCCMVHVGMWCVAGLRQITRVRQLYFSCLLRQEMGWHDVHRPGELTARMTGDTRVMQNGMNDKLSQGIYNLFNGVLGFIFGFIFCWELTLVMLGIMPFVVLCAIIFGNKTASATSETRQQYAVAGSVATEVLENIRTVQTFGKQKFEVERFAEAVQRAEVPGMRRELFNSLSVGSTMGLIILVYTVVFFFSSYLLMWDRSSIGDIVATFLCVLLGSVGIGFFFPSLTAFTEARCAAYHLFRTIERVPVIDIDDEEGKISVESFQREMEFRDVRFSYPTRSDQLLFQKLNLTIRKGEKVAFSGASGCGKSSIIGLLQRFYDPTDGAICVDGVDLRSLNLQQWRQQIGIVSQEPNLFAGSMIDNVRMGKHDATEEEVVAACKQANIHDTIMSLPDQYHTSVGAVGSQLSGGQKQRIAIARAFVKKPSILLLDEATSALDRKSEMEVQAALDQLMVQNNITVIVIAHRLATIRKVDRIFYMSNDGLEGTVIAEEGSFDQLIAKGGLFAVMARSQGAAPSSEEGPTLRDAPATQQEENEDDYPNQILSEEEIAKLEEEVPRTERQSVPIEELAEWEMQRTQVGPLRLLKLNKRYVWALVLALLGSLIAGAVAPVNTILLGKLLMSCANYESVKFFFPDVAEDDLKSDMKLYAPLFIVIAFACFVGWVLQFFYGFAGEHLTTKIRIMLFGQILRQDMSFFDTPSRDAGTLSGMLSGDCEAIHQLCGQSIGLKIQTVCTILIGIIIGLVYQWKLGLIAMACLPLIVFAVLFEQMLMSGLNDGKKGDGDDTLVTEALSNVRTITSFNLKQNRCEALHELLKNTNKKRIRRNILVGIIFGLSQFVYYGSFALCYWYGGKLIAKGETDFEKVNVASLAVLLGAMSAGESGGFAAKIGDARKASLRVFSVVDRVPDVDVFDPQRTATIAFPPAASGVDIQFQRTQFIYPARPAQLVLSSIDLHFSPGSNNGLMGQTGCGKSTIIQLLACFYAHRRGEIKLNSQWSLSNLDIRQWRQHISIVLQEPDLFSGTVRENILYSVRAGGKENEKKSSIAQGTVWDDEDGEEELPTEEEIMQAARWAGIHDDIMAMPEGYDTNVGYKGRALSGGQKQRVAIARGLLRRGTKLLLLDEATSALDNHTERVVQEGIEHYLQHRRQQGQPVTVVSIAHRLTTIQHCDQIVLLDAGRIKEQGSHAALMALGGEYKVRFELFTAGVEGS